jgi:hypothetical protein
MTTSKNNEYIIYATTNENLLQILKDGYINNKPKNKLLGHYMGIHSPKQIPTQLMYYNIPNQANMWPYMNACIVFDKTLLQDYSFKATPRFDSDMIINSGKGKLLKPPKLTKIKSYISKAMTKKQALDIHTRFMDSHTINFNKNIPLNSYAKKIMFIGKKDTYNKERELIDSIVKLSNTRAIPIKFRDYKLRGNLEKPLNNFINSIENK